MKLPTGDQRRAEFISALDTHGWQVECAPEVALALVQQWWVSDVWTITSNWTPSGCELLMIWVKQDTVGGLLPEQPAVRIYFHRSNHGEVRSFDDLEEGPSMSLHHWPRELNAFLSQLSNLRTKLGQAEEIEAAR